MDNSSSISTFMGMFRNYFLEKDLPQIEKQLERLEPEVLNQCLAFTEFNNPSKVWLYSFFLGFLGVDRFMIDSSIIGLLKFMSCGGMGILWGLDLFIIKYSTRKSNLELLTKAINTARKDVKKKKENEGKIIEKLNKD